MLEKFTQGALDIVEYAQKMARDLGHNVVYSEHLLLAILKSTKGVEAKIFEMAGMNFEEMELIILRKLKEKSYFEANDEIPFTKSATNILKMAVKIAKENSSNLVMPQHLSLAILYTQNFGAYKILDEYDFDREKVIMNLRNLI